MFKVLLFGCIRASLITAGDNSYPVKHPEKIMTVRAEHSKCKLKSAETCNYGLFNQLCSV